jgi:hypothetical protein
MCATPDISFKNRAGLAKLRINLLFSMGWIDFRGLRWLEAELFSDYFFSNNSTLTNY